MADYSQTMKDWYDKNAMYQQATASSGPTMYIPPPNIPQQQPSYQGGYQYIPQQTRQMSQDDDQPWPWKQQQPASMASWGPQGNSPDWTQQKMSTQQVTPMQEPAMMFEMVGRRNYQDTNRIPGLEDSNYQPATYSHILPNHDDAPVSDAMARAMQRELGSSSKTSNRSGQGQQKQNKQQQQNQREKQMQDLRQQQHQQISQQQPQRKQQQQVYSSLRPTPMDTLSHGASFSSAPSQAQVNSYSLMGYPKFSAQTAPTIESMDVDAQKRRRKRGGKKNRKNNLNEDEDVMGLDNFDAVGMDKYGYMAQAEAVYNHRQGEPNKPGSWKWQNPDASSNQRNRQSSGGANQQDRHLSVNRQDDLSGTKDDDRRRRTSSSEYSMHSHPNQQARGHGWPTGKYMSANIKEDKIMNLMDIGQAQKIARHVKEKLDREMAMERNEIETVGDVFKKQSVTIVDQPAKNKPVQIKLQVNKGKKSNENDSTTDWTKCELCNIVISGNSEEAYRNHCRGIVHLQKMVDQQIEQKKKGDSAAKKKKVPTATLR